MISVATNLAAMEVQRQMKVNTDNKKKSTEKLSSGYRINRAADDAAGLTISQKLRSQVRGLNQGAYNGEDGASWVRIGDGTLNEVHDMIHRMNELTIKSLNETNTPADKAAIQQEFDKLQSEIDRITDNSTFNTKKIFMDHDPTYYQCEGNAEFDNSEIHSVYVPKNTLIVTYKMPEGDDAETEKEVTITVPEGTYTTQELADEIEDAIFKTAAKDDGLYMSLTGDGTFNLNLEGGTKIDKVGGGLSYLLYDSYDGGSVGSLLGTTVFTSDSAKLYIQTGKNDNMSFSIEDFDGNTSSKSITLPQGFYTRDQLIDKLNNALTGTGVTAKKYGTGIMMGSDNAIISNFKGNMFQIDDARYTSVFYDNVNHGNVQLTAGQFTGGAVLPISSDPRDEEHTKFSIQAGVNDKLTLQPNGASSPTTVTLAAGNYSIDEMKDQLNSKLSSAGLNVTASTYSANGYYGIKLTSTQKGIGSEVKVDPSSSAFDTLFVERSYNQYRNDAAVTNETTPDTQATVTGGKTFDGVTGNNSYINLPLNITSGSNDKFTLSIDGNSVNVTVASGSYTTSAQVAQAVDDALNSDAMGAYKGKLSASVYNVGNLKGQIRITAEMGITNLVLGEVSGNSGLKDIFTTNRLTTDNSFSGSAFTSERVFPEPSSITSADNNIRVYSQQNGVYYDLKLPTGNAVTRDEIISSLNAQKQEKSDVVYNTTSPYQTINGATNNFTNTGSGQSSYVTTAYSSSGSTTAGTEGEVGEHSWTQTPAKITINTTTDSFKIDSSNNTLNLNLNGTNKTITVSAGTYNTTTLAQALQNGINSAFGTGEGSATVAASGSKGLTITGILGENLWGEDNNIYCDTSGSTLLKELNTTRTGAVMTTNRSLASTIDITDSSNTFNFKLNNQNKSITLSSNTYTPSSLIDEMNRKLSAAGIPVTASLYSGRLRLSTNEVGSDKYLEYSSASGGSATEALYDGYKTPGSQTLNPAMLSSITIASDASEFKYNLNGTTKTVSLTPGTYDRTHFISMLNTKLEGVTASVENGRLKLTTDQKGAGNSVSVSYISASPSAMPSIWGKTEREVPKVTAGFDPSGHLTLTSDDGSSFYLTSADTTIMPKSVTESNSSFERHPGYESSGHAAMDGKNLTISDSSPLVIDQWNDDLKFRYYKGVNDNTGANVDVKVPQGTYTSYDQLKTALQTALDNAVGAGELTATVDANGVNIQAVKTGTERFIGTYNTTGRRNYFSSNAYTRGDFYDKVMCTSNEVTQRQGTLETVGSNVTDPKNLAYTIGRKDVKHHPVKIMEGVNDTLTMDVQYPGGNKTLTMKLDPGVYSGGSLTDMIQEKLDAQLTAAGLPKGMIEAKIGGVQNNVAGSNNDNALNFMLSSSVKLPGEGTYVIDGIGGNAAFSVFYQTDGELVPAYIAGAKDLRGGVTITPENNELSFKTDGAEYSLTIPEADYTTQELLDELNDQLTAQGAPVRAELDDKGALKISHKKMGNHPISEVSGSAKGTLMFNENGRISDDKGDIDIQMSGVYDDVIKIERPRCDSTALGINTITVTRKKYAEKALGRLTEALNKVSSIRSRFGAEQNRLEHAIDINRNSSENTDAADSRLADTDMAAESVKLAKHNIVQQAAEAMLTQANNTHEGVLNLLK